MGQRIEIEDRRTIDGSAIFTTNRSLTGADGEGYSSPEEASEADTFGAKLAADLFETVEAVSRVYVASNVTVIQSDSEWDDERLDGVTNVIEEFFLHY